MLGVYAIQNHSLDSNKSSAKGRDSRHGAWSYKEQKLLWFSSDNTRIPAVSQEPLTQVKTHQNTSTSVSFQLSSTLIT